MVNLPLQANHASPRLSVASESRVPVLQCWVNRFVTFAVGPISNAPSLNGMAKGITGYVSRINRSVLSAAWKHRMRVSERHSSPAATASQSAGQFQNGYLSFQVTLNPRKLYNRNSTYVFVAPSTSCLAGNAESNGAARGWSRGVHASRSVLCVGEALNLVPAFRGLVSE